MGHALTTQLLQCSDTTSDRALDIHFLPRSADAKLFIVRLDPQQPGDAHDAMQWLEETANIFHLDCVIVADELVDDSGTLLRDIRHDTLAEHVQANALAPLQLFQATEKLLSRRLNGKAVFAARLDCLVHRNNAVTGCVPVGAYGLSKAILSLLTQRIHAEHKVEIISFAIDPQ